MARWQWRYQPTTFMMTLSMLGGRNPIPVVNVCRFENGKIVEIWNHRHDIDIGFAANLLRARGFALGLLSSAVMALGLRIWFRRHRA